MASKIKKGNFIVIQSFMLTDLKLKGNELLTYALIYGFSQDGENKFTGSLSYIAEWTNTTKRSVMGVLKKLVSKGLLEKEEKFVNGLKFCTYSAKVFTGGENVSQGDRKVFTGGGEKSSPNNIYNNIDKKIEKDNGVCDNDIKKTKRDEGYTDDFLIFWRLYDKIINKKKTFVQWKKKQFTTEELEEVMKKVKLYVDNTEKRFRKDPERYVRDNCWENEVIIKSTGNNKSTDINLTDVV